jgi:hypothetical protein
VQHERVCIRAQFGDDERYPLSHETGMKGLKPSPAAAGLCKARDEVPSFGPSVARLEPKSGSIRSGMFGYRRENSTTGRFKWFDW